MYNFFKCPKCGKSFSLPTSEAACTCGFVAPCNNNIYQLTNDPYMVKDENANVKYIGYEDIGEAYSGGAIFKAQKMEDKFTQIAKIIDDGILLDLACGDGLFTVPLLQLGIKIIAMDISDKMLSLLHKRAENVGVNAANLVVCRANALDIPLTNNSVDAAIANSMLHLISKPELVVNEIHRVLKKGGKFITLEDKPTTNQFNDQTLSEKELHDNSKHEEMAGFVHHRYFEILKDEYEIQGTRYSWKFDRESICNNLFSTHETIVVPMNSKVQYSFNDSFIYRMKGKGYSDQSDVPFDIHHIVFDRVMDEFNKKYGIEALDAVYTGWENDIEITVYVK